MAATSLTVQAFVKDTPQKYTGEALVADMVFTPAQLVSLISYDMTLEPGDVIACGTSVGAGSMKPGSIIQICIDGVGTLENRYEA